LEKECNIDKKSPALGKAGSIRSKQQAYGEENKWGGENIVCPILAIF
jgi:hypothetical protein